MILRRTVVVVVTLVMVSMASSDVAFAPTNTGVATARTRVIELGVNGDRATSFRATHGTCLVLSMPTRGIIDPAQHNNTFKGDTADRKNNSLPMLISITWKYIASLVSTAFCNLRSK